MAPTVEEALTSAAQALRATVDQTGNGVYNVSLSGLSLGQQLPLDFTTQVTMPLALNLAFLSKHLRFLNDGMPASLLDEHGQLLSASELDVIGGVPVPGLQAALGGGLAGGPANVVEGRTDTPGVPGILGIVQGSIQTLVDQTTTGLHAVEIELRLALRDLTHGRPVANAFFQPAVGDPLPLPTGLTPLNDLLNEGSIKLLIPPPFVELTQAIPDPIDLELQISIRVSTGIGSPPVPHASDEVDLPPVHVPLVPVPVPRLLALFNLRDFSQAAEPPRSDATDPDGLDPRDGDLRMVAVIVPEDSLLGAATDALERIEQLAIDLAPFVAIASTGLATLPVVAAAVAAFQTVATAIELGRADRHGMVGNLHDAIDWASRVPPGIGRISPDDNVRSLLLIGPPSARATCFVNVDGHADQGAIDLSVGPGLVTAISSLNWSTPPPGTVMPDPMFVRITSPPRPPFEKQTFENQFSSVYLEAAS